MKKVLFIATASLILTGCATSASNGRYLNDPKNVCQQPVERNLTIAYEDREYWCAPKAYIKDLPKKTTLQKQQPKEIVSVPTPVLSYQITEIVFYKHDTQYDQDAVRSLLNNQSDIKLRGCRLANESSSLALGRPLRVKNFLVASGFKNKITILSDKSCIGKQAVEVN